MLTIRNLSKRTVVLNLPHASACSETVCTCSRMKVGVEEHDPVSGARTVRAVNQRLGASVTLFPKGMRGAKGEPLDKADGLLDTVANTPDVIGAERRGEIAVEKMKPAEVAVVEKVKPAQEPATPDAPAEVKSEPATPAPSPPATTTKSKSKE